MQTSNVPSVDQAKANMEKTQALLGSSFSEQKFKEAVQNMGLEATPVSPTVTLARENIKQALDGFFMVHSIIEDAYPCAVISGERILCFFSFKGAITHKLSLRVTATKEEIHLALQDASFMPLRKDMSK